MSNLNSISVEGTSSVAVTTAMMNNYQKIMFSGKLIYGSTQAVKQQLQDELVDAKGYIFDMTKLEYIDSTGLGILMNLAKHSYVKGKKIAIIVIDKFLREIFEIAKFQLVFPIVDNEKRALEVIENGENTLLSINEY